MNAETNTTESKTNRAARYDVSTSVRWTPEEHAEWRVAVELEEAANQSGSFADIATAAMQHMKRKRPVNAPNIQYAGKIIRELRAQRNNPHWPEPHSSPAQPTAQPQQPEERRAGEPDRRARSKVQDTGFYRPAAGQPDARKPGECTTIRFGSAEPPNGGGIPITDAEAAKVADGISMPFVEEVNMPLDEQPAPTVARSVEVPTMRGYEPAPTPHWTESIIENLVHVGVETLVRVAESPAVRKAIRSMIEVATDKNFVPEVDTTVKWEAPKVGPKLPRVLVVGYRSMKIVHKAIEAEKKHLDLRFWRVDSSLNQLRQDLRAAEFVLISGYSNHTVREIIVSSGVPFRALTMAAGNSGLLKELHNVSSELRKARGDGGG